jgi:Flp pilus assembly protein TadG
MAIEMVLLTPILIAFVLLVVAGGRLVGRQGDVDSAARDGARAASLERTADSATAVGASVAAASLPASFRDGTTCATASVDTSAWQPGGSVAVTIRCQVSYSGLGLIGLPGSAMVEGNSVAPLDQYRRTQ